MTLISVYLLLIFLGISAISDFYYRKIPNYWIGLAVIVGLTFPWISGEWSKVTNLYLGSVLAFALFLPPYMFGVMGAADVKAFGVSGLFLGADQVITVGLNVVMIGGLLAMIYLLKEYALLILTGQKIRKNHLHAIEIPYAIAIFGGVIFTILIERIV